MKSLLFKLLCLGTILWVSVSQAAVFNVTSVADSGPGTLRQAIIDANTLAGHDEIHFNIAAGDCDAAGVCRIDIATGFPYISDAVLIDGTTQPQYGSAPINVCATENDPSYMRIEINNTGGSSVQSLVLISSEPSTIRGLSVGGSATIGIGYGNGNGHWLYCNHIGVNAEGNSSLAAAYGVCVNCYIASGMSAVSGIIGTNGDGVDDVSERNLISGVFGLSHNSGNGFIYAGNYFNLSADGLAPIAMGSRCINLRQRSQNNRIGSDMNGINDDLERNIFGQCATAVYMAPHNSYAKNIIAGNWFGVNAIGQDLNVSTGIMMVGDGKPFSGGIETLIVNNWIEGTAVALDLSGTGILSPQSSGNCLTNSTTGLKYSGDADQVFENNWWGDGSGPSGDGAGSGASLLQTGLGVVDYTPWLTESNPECDLVAGELTYRVGVTMNNLANGETAVIQNNGSFLGVSTNGFTNFITSYVNTTAYDVSVFSQPSNQTCLVTDGSGVIDFADVTDVVIDCNSAPAVVANSYVMDEDTILIANDTVGIGSSNDDSVLLDDIDPEGDTLQVLTVGTFTASGIGGDITMAADGTFTYTPVADAYGQATFAFEVSDGLNTVSSSLSIDVLNVDDDPIAVADAYLVAEDSVDVILLVLDNDTDIDMGPMEVIAVTQPVNGEVTFTSESVSYSPDADYCDEDSADEFTYTLNGGSLASVSVSVECVNDAPSFTILGDVDATDLVDASNTTLVIPGFASNFVMGPANESSQQVLAIFTDIDSDTDGVLNSIGISNDGTLTLDFTLNLGVALIDAYLQDDGGTDLMGIDTSDTVSFMVAYTDLIFLDGFEQISVLAIEKMINSLKVSSPYVETPYYDDVNQVISFLGRDLYLSNQAISLVSLPKIKFWLEEVLKRKSPYGDADGDGIENLMDESPFELE